MKTNRISDTINLLSELREWEMQFPGEMPRTPRFSSVRKARKYIARFFKPLPRFFWVVSAHHGEDGVQLECVTRSRSYAQSRYDQTTRANGYFGHWMQLVDSRSCTQILLSHYRSYSIN